MYDIKIGQKREWLGSGKVFTVESHVEGTEFYVCRNTDGTEERHDGFIIHSRSFAHESSLFIQEGTLKMSDDKIRELRDDKIGVLYGNNSYGCSLSHINDLKACILNDYPDTKDEEIEAWFITPTMSRHHARQTMLWVHIPVEDFLNLKQDGKIHIL